MELGQGVPAKLAALSVDLPRGQNAGKRGLQVEASPGVAGGNGRNEEAGRAPFWWLPVAIW